MRTGKKRTCTGAAGLLVLLAAPLMAGSGTFNAGVYEFCVSVRFNANAQQLTNIRTAFREGNRIFADATDGQQRWGRITIVNNSGCSESSEFWIFSGSGRANATRGEYGVRGQHVNMYYDGNGSPGIDTFQTPTSPAVAYTLAHEMAHHAFGVLDEYSGPGIGESAHCALLSAESPSLEYSLMDNYYARGGRGPGAGGAFTLNEFCVRDNHDRDGLTWQTHTHGKSAWETIAAHPTRSARAPAGLPNSAPPAVAAPVFEDGVGGLRVMVVVDRSGSMSDDNRLVFAKQAAALYIQALQAGDQLGVVAFDSVVGTIFPITQITSQTTKNGAISAINALAASGNTNIGGGLQTASAQLLNNRPRSCDELIVLLTDGDHNTGPDPLTVASQIGRDGITVLTVGTGGSISADGQAVLQEIASRTGGKYFGLSSSFGLLGLFFQIWTESTGNGLLVRAPLSLAANTPQEVPVTVELGSRSVTFGVALLNVNANVSVALRSPSNVVYTSDAQVINAGGTVDRSAANAVLYTFPSPQAGVWRVTPTARSATQVEVFAGSVNTGVELLVGTDKPSVRAPGEVRIHATPEFGGLNLIRATVDGQVIRPDGSVIPVVLSDDGSRNSGDQQANDGVYNTRFSAFNSNGGYTVQLRVSGSAAFAQGESFGQVLGEPAPAPLLTRVSTASFLVSGLDPCENSLGELFLNTPVLGRLSSASCLANGRYLGIYTFSGAAGQRISIALDSADFDTYLALFDPDAEIIAEDDDSGPGSNSRIPAVGEFTLPVTGTYFVVATSFGGGELGAYTLTVSGAVAPPAFTVGGVVNGGSYVGGGVSPGEIVAIFGSNIGPGALTAQGIVNNAIPKSLGPVTVTFDGVPAPILYTSGTQLGAVVPYSVAGRSQVTVQVRNGTATSSSVVVPVVAAKPGLFTASAAGTGQGAILNADYSFNSPNNAAPRGSVVALYMTGVGQMTPASADGALTLITPLPQPNLPVTVTIGGQNAEVLYAGAAPSLVAGAVQVNVRIPANVAAGSQPVIVRVGNIASQAGVTVAVR